MYDDLNINKIVLFEVGTNRLDGLNVVDDLFKCLKNSKNKSEAHKILVKLEKQLKMIFGTDFEMDIDYFAQDHDNAFVVPVYRGYDEIIKTDKEVKLKAIRKVYIMLGATLINNHTPREITAVILHEIGHIVNHLTETQQIIENATYPIHNMLHRLIYIPIINVVALPIMILSSRTLSFTSHIGEYNADKFAVEYGYGDELIMTMHKMGAKYTKHSPNNFSIKRWLNILIDLLLGGSHPSYDDRVKKMIQIIKTEYSKQYKNRKLETFIEKNYS